MSEQERVRNIMNNDDSGRKLAQLLAYDPNTRSIGPSSGSGSDPDEPIDFKKPDADLFAK